MTKSEDNPEMRVLRSATCDTISKNSKLCYHIGATPDSEIHLRVFSNLGSGNFSKEWIALKDIQTALDKRHKGQHVTAYLLQPLFKAKSVNTPAFLLAVLAQEKLVRVLKGKKREHEILDPSAFIEKVEKLIASGVDVKVKEPTKTTKKTTAKTVSKTPAKKITRNTATKASTKKAAVKKKSTARRKTAKTG